jgi:serine/threonine protein kinase
MSSQNPPERIPNVEIRSGHIVVDGDHLEVADHTIVEEISRGASGIVFRYWNAVLHRTEALKIWLRLRPKDSRDKFDQGIREARAAARVKSKAAVVVYSAGVLADKYFYITMEFIEGLTLLACLERGMSRRDRIALARTYLDRLEEAEMQGIVHGDAHGRNVMIDSSSTLRLLDFGTSRFTGSHKFRRRHCRLVEETLRVIFQSEIERYALAARFQTRHMRPTEYYPIYQQYVHNMKYLPLENFEFAPKGVNGGKVVITSAYRGP